MYKKQIGTSLAEGDKVGYKNDMDRRGKFVTRLGPLKLYSEGSR